MLIVKESTVQTIVNGTGITFNNPRGWKFTIFFFDQLGKIRELCDKSIVLTEVLEIM